MTRQEKKDILKKYPYFCEKIEELNNQLEEIRAAGERITSNLQEGSKNLPTSSKVEKAAVKLPDIEQKLKRYQDQKQSIENSVNRLRGNQRELVKMVYYNRISQNRAAQLLHKTPNTIRAVLNNAIDNLELPM